MGVGMGEKLNNAHCMCKVLIERAAFGLFRISCFSYDTPVGTKGVLVKVSRETNGKVIIKNDVAHFIKTWNAHFFKPFCFLKCLASFYSLELSMQCILS